MNETNERAKLLRELHAIVETMPLELLRNIIRSLELLRFHTTPRGKP